MMAFVLLVLVALPFVLPAHNYTATQVSFEEQINISNRTLIEGARMNSEVVLFGSLSSQQQTVFRESVKESSDTASIRGSLFSGIRYVVGNTTSALYRVNLITRAGGNALEVAPVTGQDALSTLAVPTTVFSNSSSFYAPVSKRQIARSTIEDGEYENPVILRVNQTAVSYNGKYYILNRSRI